MSMSTIYNDKRLDILKNGGTLNFFVDNKVVFKKYIGNGDMYFYTTSMISEKLQAPADFTSMENKFMSLDLQGKSQFVLGFNESGMILQLNNGFISLFGMTDDDVLLLEKVKTDAVDFGIVSSEDENTPLFVELFNSDGSSNKIEFKHATNINSAKNNGIITFSYLNSCPCFVSNVDNKVVVSYAPNSGYSSFVIKEGKDLKLRSTKYPNCFMVDDEWFIAGTYAPFKLESEPLDVSIVDDEFVVFCKDGYTYRYHLSGLVKGPKTQKVLDNFLSFKSFPFGISVKLLLNKVVLNKAMRSGDVKDIPEGSIVQQGKFVQINGKTYVVREQKPNSSFMYLSPSEDMTFEGDVLFLEDAYFTFIETKNVSF